MFRRTRGVLLVLSMVGVITLGSAQAAAAAGVLTIPAITFVIHCIGADCPLSIPAAVGTAQNGTLTAAKGTWFAAVVFPESGVNVCRFTLWHRDNDGDFSIKARLLRKPAMEGTAPFDAPTVMAAVRTLGANATVRRVTTANITSPLVDPIKYYYYAELDIPADTLEILAVQIFYSKSCA